MPSLSFLPLVALSLLCLLSNILLALPTARFDHVPRTLSARDPSELAHDVDMTEAHAHRLHRRGLPGAVYICTADNFRGSCAWTAPNDRCHIAGTGNNSARSIGPDENGFCILYEKATCTGTQIKTLRFPGQATNMPTFMSLQCHSDTPPKTNATGSGLATTGTFAKSSADPRLAGGVGSMERKELEQIMEKMEHDGFKQGMIGLKKGHYY